MMFYTTVAGWMLHYFYMTAVGKLAGLNAEQVAGKFTEMLASPATMTFWMVFVVVVSNKVLRDIRELDCSEEFRLFNFGQSFYKNEQGKSVWLRCCV